VNRILSACLLLPSLVLPARAQAPAATLPNGLAVEVRHEPGSRAMTAVLIVPAGTAQGGGLAALAPHALRLGGGGPYGYRDVDLQLEGLGATMEAESGPDFSALRLRFFPQDSRAVLGILAAHVSAPIYPELRATFARGRREARLDPAELAFSALLGGEGSQAWREAGPEALKAWHRSHWTPGSARLLVSGPMEPGAVRSHLQAAFGGWAAAPAGGTPPRAAAAASGGFHLRLDPGTEPCVILAGVPVATEAEEIALDLALDAVASSGEVPQAGPGWRALRITAAAGKAADEARRLRDALARLGQQGLPAPAFRAALARWQEGRAVEAQDPERRLLREARARLRGAMPEPTLEGVNAALKQLLRTEDVRVLVVGQPRPAIPGARAFPG
jgi:hypothetical protein